MTGPYNTLISGQSCRSIFCPSIFAHLVMYVLHRTCRDDTDTELNSRPRSPTAGAPQQRLTLADAMAASRRSTPLARSPDGSPPAQDSPPASHRLMALPTFSEGLAPASHGHGHGLEGGHLRTGAGRTLSDIIPTAMNAARQVRMSATSGFTWLLCYVAAKWVKKLAPHTRLDSGTSGPYPGVGARGYNLISEVDKRARAVPLFYEL